MKKITDYAEFVKAKHALNKTIAPVEDGANIAGSYTSGKQFIRGGVLYTALTTIAANTAWSSLTLDTDYELADDLTSQLASLNQTLTQDLILEVDTRKRFNVDNLGETTLSGSGTVGSISYVVNADKSITITVNSTLSEVLSIPIVNGWSGFDISEHIGEKLIVSGYNNSFCLHTIICDSNDQLLLSVVSPENGNTIIVPSGAKKCVFLLSLTAGITAGSTFTYYPRLSVAMTNQEMTPYVQAISNPNLLDNPWFTVNQRGQATYNVAGYSVDRWRISNGVTATLNADGSISLSSTVQYADFAQRLIFDEFTAKLLGKTVTLSALLSDGTVKKNTFTLPSTRPSSATTYGEFEIASGVSLRLRVWDSSVIYSAIQVTMNDTSATVTLKAVKLELGTVSTLANDTAPNYATELLKCQRYYYKYDGSTEPFAAYINEVTSVRTSFPLPVPMRAIPNLTFNYTSPYGQCGIYIPAGVSAITPTNITVPSGQDVKKPSVLLESTISSDSRVVAQTSCCQRFNTSMSFSADL